MLACIEVRENARKYRGKTAETYRSYTLRTIESIQALERIPEDQPVSVEVLSRTLFDRLQARDRQSDASDMMRYAPLRLLLDCWRWMVDDPERWPHVPRPPYSSKDFLPRTPKYGRTIAPSIPHLDAALRPLKPRVERPTLMLGIFMRYTGLRAKQVLAIHRADVNIEGRMLYDVTGKTNREQADLRPFPLAARLFDEPGVLDFLALAEPDRPLFRKGGEPDPAYGLGHATARDRNFLIAAARRVIWLGEPRHDRAYTGVGSCRGRDSGAVAEFGGGGAARVAGGHHRRPGLRRARQREDLGAAAGAAPDRGEVGRPVPRRARRRRAAGRRTVGPTADLRRP
jgi:integrase